ncbi:MAG: toxin-antitoxin system HicB family antitoxin [Bacillota bacterium]
MPNGPIKLGFCSTLLEDGVTIPEPEENADDGYSGRLVFRMPRSLHKSLANQAKREGVSLNQLILYHLSRSAGLPKPPSR